MFLSATYIFQSPFGWVVRGCELACILFDNFNFKFRSVFREVENIRNFRNA